MIAQISRLTAVTLISVFLFSCAIKTAQTRPDAPQSAEIQDIRITEGNGKTIIEIEGEELMIYTTFQLTEPNRLIIDIAGIELGPFDQEIHLESGPIRSLRPIAGGGSNVTRLELLLEETVEARVSSDGANLIIDADEAGRMNSKFVFFGDGETSPAKVFDGTVETQPEEQVEVNFLEPENTETAFDPSAVLSTSKQGEPGLEEVVDLSLMSDSEEVIGLEKSIKASEPDIETDLVSSASSLEEGHDISSEALEGTGQDSLARLEAFSGEPTEALSTPFSEKTLPEPSELPSDLFMSEASEAPSLVSMPTLDEVEVTEPEPLAEDSSAFFGDPFGDPLEGLPEDPLEVSEIPGTGEEMEDVSVAQELPTEILLTDMPALEKEALLEEKPLPIAKWVKAIQFVKSQALQLVITLDGTLRPRIFRVDKNRIAIDLLGVKTKLKQTKILAGDPLVKQVRIGVHAAKLRLVVDHASALSYTWEQKREKVVLIFRDPSAKAPSSPVKEAEMTEVATGTSDLSPASDFLPFEENETEGDAMGDSLDLVEILEPMEFTALAPSLNPEPDPLTFKEDTIEEAPIRDSSAQINEVEQTKVVTEVKLVASDINPAPEPSFLSPPLKGKAVEDLAITTLPPPLVFDPGELLAAPVDKNLEAEKVEAQIHGEDASLPEPSSEPLIAPMISSDEKNVSPETAAAVEKKAEVERKHRLRKRTFLRHRRAEKTKQGKNLFVHKRKGEEIQPESPQPKYTGKKVSLDFQDAEISNVIRLIADVSRLNFVMGQDVKGKVSLKLSNVPWDQALDVILEMNSLGKVRQGNIIRITTLANLANQRDEKARAKETEVNSADLITRVIYVNYGKAEEAKILLEKLLSSRGEIMVDKRTNAMIVKDIEENLDQIKRLSKKLDTKTPQVLIEARIAEVKPSFKKSLGVQWGADLSTTRGGNILGVGNAASGSAFNAPTPDFAVNLPASNNLGGVGFTFGRFTQSPFTLDLRLSAGEVQETTRIVSSPKIMVLDNHEALIEQGESIPFQTSSGNDGTKTQFIDANLTLKVTPHISPDGGILLDIHLTKNEPALITEAGAPGPRIFKKEITTKILLMDGETVVIGGIYESKSSETESGIPWFKDLPLIGWLFKNESSSKSITELLVFITPTIMD